MVASMAMSFVRILTALILVGVLGPREVAAAEPPTGIQGQHDISPSRGSLAAPLLTTLSVGSEASQGLRPEELGFPAERKLTLIADDIPGRLLPSIAAAKSSRQTT